MHWQIHMSVGRCWSNTDIQDLGALLTRLAVTTNLNSKLMLVACTLLQAQPERLGCQQAAAGCAAASHVGRGEHAAAAVWLVAGGACVIASEGGTRCGRVAGSTSTS